MRTARARANRSPEEIDYVEAHATGTVVGDRIEGNSISEAFQYAGRKSPLRISSVKSNVGHMEAAAFHCGAAQGADHEYAAANLCADLQDIPGAEPGDRLRQLPHAGTNCL